MRRAAPFPKKEYYIILFSIMVLSIFLSLDVFIKVKDYSLFLLWVENNNDTLEGLTETEMFSTYVTANMSYYFFKILVPMFFGIQSYFAYTKTRISNVYTIVWGILLAGASAYHILELDFDSVFYYIIAILYLTITITILVLHDSIRRK